MGWRQLVLLGVAGLIVSVRGCTPGQAFRWGMFWGLAAFATGLSWLMQLFNVFAVVLWLILALFPALFALWISWAARRLLSGWQMAGFIAFAWTGIEFIRCELMPLRFPWMSVGLALEPWPLVSWIGVYGLGLATIALIAALLYRAWLCALSILACCVFAWFMEPEDFLQPNITITAIQAETAPLSEYLALSQNAPPGTQMILWPEYAVPKDVRVSSDLAKIHAFAAQESCLMVFGTQTGLGGAKWQNTALTIDGSSVLGEHGKVHTVHFFDDGEHGPTAKAIETPLGKIGTPICFDCDFQDVVRHMVLDGATFFAVPSMDAAHWSAKQHIQHAQLFRLRAAENRRDFAIAASSGVSQMIHANSATHQQLAAMQKGVLHGKLTARSSITFFTRWGWLTPWLALLVSCMWTMRLMMRSSLAHRPA